MNNSSAIPWREQDKFISKWWCPLCSRLTHLVGIFSTSSLFRGYAYGFTLTYYHDSEPTSFCSFSLLLCPYQRCNTHQFYSLWLDSTRGRKLWSAILQTRTLTNVPPCSYDSLDEHTSIDMTKSAGILRLFSSLFFISFCLCFL